MEAIDRKFNSVKTRGGSALILVVVLTVLLALIGAMFILMSRIDEMATKSIKPNQLLNAAAEKIVDRFSVVLVEDIYGNGSSSFRFDPSSSIIGMSNESWDYPSPDTLLTKGDPWLACLEPTDLDPDPAIVAPGFLRISDLYNMGLASSNFLAEIFDDDAVAAFGAKADADGDGVSDSRWIIIPYMTTEKGENIYAAIRIIDNGGMINVNTAYCNTTALGGQWDGSKVAHVNLNGIMATTETSTIDDLHLERCRLAPLLVADFEIGSARRPERPFPGYVPFGIGEELELRNRYFLSSSCDFRLGFKDAVGTPHLWQKTFDPGQGRVGKKIPYKTGDTIKNWYEKLKPDMEQPGYPSPFDDLGPIGYYNRRFLSTTYNSDRIARPYSATSYPASMNATLMTPLSEEHKIGVTLPQKIQDTTENSAKIKTFIKRLAMGICRGLPEDSSIENRFGFEYDREKLAWQMAVNMVDYQDANSLGTESVTKYKDQVTNTTYFGTEDIATLKRDTLFISKLGFVDVDVTTLGQYGGTVNSDKEYLAIELFNPDDAGSKNLTDYKLLIISDSDKLEYTYDEFPSLTLTASTGSDNTAVIVFSRNSNSTNEARAALSANQVDHIKQLTLSDFDLNLLAADYKFVVIKKSTDLPVDSVSLLGALLSAPEDTVRQCYRRIAFKDTNFLIPSWSSATSDKPWEGFGINPTGWKLGENIDTADFEDPTDPASPVYDPNLAGIEKVQFDAPNEQLRSIGQMENIFAVGASYLEDTSGLGKHICRTLWQGVMESVVAVKELYLETDGDDSTFPDLTADQDGAVEMGSFGRIRLDVPSPVDPTFKPLFWGLLDSLTCFDPARDGVYLDNIAEGNIPTTTGTIDGGTVDSLTDGEFIPANTPWNSGTVYWIDPDVTIEIDLGTPQEIWGAIVQADYDDEYVLEYHDGITWQFLLTVDNHDPLGAFTGGMQTRPDVYDDGLWQLLDTPVLAQRFRIQAVSTTGPSPEFSLSEIKLGIKTTTIDPYYHPVAGLININTAPWYVINQLPWLEDISAADPASLAQAIVAFRDKATTPLGDVDYSGPTDGFATGRFEETDISGISETPGFTNIAQLMQVINQDSLLVDFDIRKNIFDNADADFNAGDYTPDTAIDDFEERNLIFHRISNLVTVRSDVFTAYILVRIGENGPQRRMIAILDRSEVNSPTDKPKILAIHPVPDPR